MNSTYFFTFAITLIFSFSAQAATLDIEKFRAKAQSKIESVLGKKNISGGGSIIFRDGAGSIDLEPVFDYASFIYVVKTKDGVLPVDGLQFGFRLRLNGLEDLVMISPSQDGELVISMPEEGVAVLAKNAPLKSVNELIERLTQIAPEGVFYHLKSVEILTYKAPVSKTLELFSELRKSPVVKFVDLSYEKYRVIFKFDRVMTVEDSGKIDADKYRDVTKKLKDGGYRFVSETTIPGDLQ